MKANKALKRLAKIEALISNVTERYSANAPAVRQVLQDAKTAVARAKEAMSLLVSSRTAKNHPAKHSEPPSTATPQSAKPKRRLSAAGRKAVQEALKRRRALKRAEPAKPRRAAKRAAPGRKRAAAKKAAVDGPSAKTVKKRSLIKRAAKKRAAKKTAPAPAELAMEAAAQEPMAAPPELNDRPDSAYGIYAKSHAEERQRRNYLRIDPPRTDGRNAAQAAATDMWHVFRHGCHARPHPT